MPSPTMSASRIAHASPVPAHTMFGSDCDVASEPIAWTDCLSNTGTNVLPLSTDFHTPPDAAPRYQVFRSPATPAIEAKRPPAAGPRNWNRNGGAALPPRPAPPRCAYMGADRATERISAARWERFMSGIFWRGESKSRD